MKEKFLQVKDLEVIYKTDLETVYAVNNISFDLDKGETLGLVGETGAGKTTTALSILRLLPERTAQITNGSIELEGRNVLELSEKEMQKIRGEKVSMIFQDPMTALNPVLTVGDQIAESLQLHDDQGRSKEVIDARVEEVLELVGIPAARKKDYPHQFSGGMKQRVVIAIALACNPGLLIADEPTTALDVTIQAQVLAMMQELKEKLDTAMIMITHDLGIVAQTCDKVAVMYAGEIIEYGTVEDIFTGDAHHPYTVGLFGSIPSLEGDEERLHPIDGMMPDPTDLPSGCYFSPRCPKCTEQCRGVHPEEAVSGTHKIRCHLFENLAKEV
ncbi:ABC transporter ATP-binding protein [Anaerotruncus sp. 80]|jgi:peptide/nickel transport system ATP-binding protein|uniref:ABC transporter ATP-binding protein n=1 Tax=Anaerotruncus colihominis TaxID=169435 RepID=A0A845QGK3_9FIRM|nr:MULTISPECIES: ABC transporter ATP-binding protein [Anaerotruncus]NBH61232.1 ABC transporter ATP-binding protein [Anaerotruncus colihominis]NCF01887.1 ABC transporter ATP-binding protein [Anaerotruncus sp. 80]